LEAKVRDTVVQTAGSLVFYDDDDISPHITSHQNCPICLLVHSLITPKLSPYPSPGWRCVMGLAWQLPCTSWHGPVPDAPVLTPPCPCQWGHHPHGGIPGEVIAVHSQVGVPGSHFNSSIPNLLKLGVAVQRKMCAVQVLAAMLRAPATSHPAQ
jgi:hypothetical protein